jgi:hypothetical protein
VLQSQCASLAAAREVCGEAGAAPRRGRAGPEQRLAEHRARNGLEAAEARRLRELNRAQVHKGEAIVPRAYNPAAGGSAPGGDALARRVDAMVAELQGLRAEVRSTAQHTAKTARILDRVAQDGNAFVTVAQA